MTRTGLHNNKAAHHADIFFMSGMLHVMTCPAYAFHCFCYKLYYVSNFKDFNTIAPAC